MKYLTLIPGKLSLADLRQAYFGRTNLILDDGTWADIEASREVVHSKVEGGEIVYGVNTGFGRLASKHIEKELLS